ncbi:MAG: S46 family peptidase [Ignavibacteriaceae bacterium]
MTSRKRNYLLKNLIVIILLLIAGCSSSQQLQNNNSIQPDYSWLNLDTVKAGKFDTGRMWTFDYPPIKYFEETYNFKPSEKWLEDVRLSALRFATYCSASFVSSDGLIMTNDHCARESVTEVASDSENLSKNGFWAKNLEDERPVPGLFVDQLVLIKDVTNEIQQEIAQGKTEADKELNKEKAIAEIEKRESDSTGLQASVVPLYNGGRYSLYGYKRYNDVRLVFAPESELGFFGGDYDNFTYPRYDLDCSFFRVYDNGKPLKTKHYFKWSANGAKDGEPVFVIGNPGSTNRLNSVSQLEYLRDITYPRMVDLLDGLVNIYSKLLVENPDRENELRDQLLRYTNSQKAYEGMLKGLRNPVLLQKKKDFEEKFKAAVKSNPNLNTLYGNLWKEIWENRNDLRKISNEQYALEMNPVETSEYFTIAQEMVELAQQLKLPEDQRYYYYRGDDLDTTVNEIFPEGFDSTENKQLLKEQLLLMVKYLGRDNMYVKELIDHRSINEATDYLINNSSLTSEEKIKELVKQGPDAILNSKDPFIVFIIKSENRRKALQQEASQLETQNDWLSGELGKALYDVYGTSIPPDATFTLRISDGIVKGFPYNGTIAPPVTTFYGLYNRYYSFNKKFPWSLPKRWQNPPKDFDLSTPFNFVATNDIIGGNSGSPVINEKGEIVGLAFDGNIQSLPGSFIFSTEENRMVAVHSEGMIEALKDIYKANRLVDELKNGKIPAEVNAAEKVTAN